VDACKPKDSPFHTDVATHSTRRILYFIQVSVVKTKNLPRSELGICSCFCTAALSSSQLHRSQIVHSVADPEWEVDHPDFLFKVFDPSQILSIKIFLWSNDSETEFGCARIRVNDVKSPGGEFLERCFPLMQQGGKLLYTKFGAPGVVLRFRTFSNMDNGVLAANAVSPQILPIEEVQKSYARLQRTAGAMLLQGSIRSMLVPRTSIDHPNLEENIVNKEVDASDEIAKSSSLMPDDKKQAVLVVGCHSSFLNLLHRGFGTGPSMLSVRMNELVHCVAAIQSAGAEIVHSSSGDGCSKGGFEGLVGGSGGPGPDPIRAASAVQSCAPVDYAVAGYAAVDAGAGPDAAAQAPHGACKSSAGGPCASQSCAGWQAGPAPMPQHMEGRQREGQEDSTAGRPALSEMLGEGRSCVLASPSPLPDARCQPGPAPLALDPCTVQPTCLVHLCRGAAAPVRTCAVDLCSGARLAEMPSRPSSPDVLVVGEAQAPTGTRRGARGGPRVVLERPWSCGTAGARTDGWACMASLVTQAGPDWDSEAAGAAAPARAGCRAGVSAWSDAAGAEEHGRWSCGDRSSEAPAAGPWLASMEQHAQAPCSRHRSLGAPPSAGQLGLGPPALAHGPGSVGVGQVGSEGGAWRNGPGRARRGGPGAAMLALVRAQRAMHEVDRCVGGWREVDMQSVEVQWIDPVPATRRGDCCGDRTGGWDQEGQVGLMVGQDRRMGWEVDP
jgi:hypothetical protein